MLRRAFDRSVWNGLTDERGARCTEFGDPGGCG